ncbi:MAG TPA: sigma-70 family RNA polymerase sigma factor [Thermoanaerobaculia bacterium]|jgi:RNA polymerase sigma-70 factor (ECF subfamily)|nr:sigma-70 family RNA polymerase sigma factor [Thermoanaerobaculia bacterium]
MSAIAQPLTMTAFGTAGDATAEQALVAASRRGDHAAFGVLVRLHERRVFRLAGRFFRRREDVEEVAQETFLRAWRKLDGYRADAPFEHWLTRICLNCCYERLRRRQLRTEELQPETAAAPAHDPTVGLEVERLLRRLSPADRFVLLLLDGEGWSVEEIADRLGWSGANVKVRAHRARKRLRRLLEEDVDAMP